MTFSRNFELLTTVAARTTCQGMLFVERRPAEVELRHGLYPAHAVCTEVVVTLELSPRMLLVPPPEEYRPRWPMVTVYPLLFPYEARHTKRVTSKTLELGSVFLPGKICFCISR